MRHSITSRQRASSFSQPGSSSLALFFLRFCCFHGGFAMYQPLIIASGEKRSEEHTSELQSLPTRRSSDLFELLPARFQFIGVVLLAVLLFPRRIRNVPAIDHRQRRKDNSLQPANQVFRRVGVAHFRAP